MPPGAVESAVPLGAVESAVPLGAAARAALPDAAESAATQRQAAEQRDAEAAPVPKASMSVPSRAGATDEAAAAA
ncbi:MAG: hypothetical protein ABIR92_10245 [Gemmatimonadaceae bacterium]